MRRLIASRNGGVAVMSAAAGALACLTAAVVIDGASVAFYARRLQTAADLAALAAARDLPRAQAAAEATARANLPGDVGVVATTGLYRPDRELDVDARFAPAAVGTANAAEARLTGEAPLWFAGRLLGRDTVRMTRRGRAATTTAPMAMITLGSRLARLEGGVANRLLSALTGSEVALTAADYNGLAEARVNLLAFTDLLATQLNLEAGDYEALLTHEVDAGALLGVVERVSNGADPALQALTRASAGRRIRVGDLIGLEASAPQGLRGALDAHVSALDLVVATLEVAGGDRQVRLDLPVRAGVADIDAWLAIGERPNRSPWLAVDDDGGLVIRTAQARLFLNVRTASGLAGIGRLDVPLIVELAAAEARLAQIDCRPDRAVEVDVRPGVARLRLGRPDVARLDDFTTALKVQPAVLVEVAGLVRISGRADLDLRSATATRLRFSDAEIKAGTLKTARSSGFVASPLAQLLAELDLQVQTLGLPLNLGGLGGAAAGLVRPLAGVLDPLVDEILETLGLSLGEADVAVPQASCGTATSPVLVG